MDVSNNLMLREITAEETYGIRLPVLRPGRPVSECQFNGDHDAGTFHLGIYKKSNLIGVASFMKNCNPLFKNEIQYQLRGMAISTENKNCGYGSLLLKDGENRIKIKSNNSILWFNARITAVDFYKKHGYESIGKVFEVPGVCEHIVMFKALSN